MPIASLDDFLAAYRQTPMYSKTAGVTSVANTWYSPFAAAGSPGAGTLAGSSTTAGVVPTAGQAGYPALASTFLSTDFGILTAVDFSNSVACRMALYDRLWVGGAYAFNANTALSAQPSFAGRVPGGDYSGLEIWVENVTAATGNLAVNVTYTNQAGTGSRTTGATGIGAAPAVARCWQLPLQSGDTGVQRIDNVAGSVASAGTFNVMVLRPLGVFRVNIANGGDTFDMLRLGAPRVYSTSAFYVLISADSTSTGLPYLALDVASRA